MNGNEIVTAIERLRSRCPGLRVELWSGYGKDGEETYLATINEYPDQILGPRAATVTGAVNSVLAIYDGRADVIRRTIEANEQKIAELRAQLAQLEAK